MKVFSFSRSFFNMKQILLAKVLLPIRFNTGIASVLNYHIKLPNIASINAGIHRDIVVCILIRNVTDEYYASISSVTAITG